MTINQRLLNGAPLGKLGGSHFLVEATAPSFPRRRESRRRGFGKRPMDSRLRGNDGVIGDGGVISNNQMEFAIPPITSTLSNGRTVIPATLRGPFGITDGDPLIGEIGEGERMLTSRLAERRP